MLHHHRRTSLAVRATTLAALLLTGFAMLPAATPNAPLGLHKVGSYNSGLGAGAAEIPAFDALSERLFAINASASSVDIVDLSIPSAPVFVSSINIDALFSDATFHAAPNSVAVSQGLVAVAVERKDALGRHGEGRIAFFDAAGNLIDQATAGALPDMVTFSPDGRYALSADEGEPSPDYSFDPEGSVTIVETERVRLTLANPQLAGQFPLLPRHTKRASFARFNNQKAQLVAAGVRIYGPNASVAQDVEPEYIAVPAGSIYAYVTLQEANAIAMVNIVTGIVARITPLGFKDWSSSALDASDRDNSILIQPWPVFGMYEPDAIATFRIGSQNYFITANEGDSRDYPGFTEEARVKNMSLDTTAFPNAATLKLDPNLGRLNCTTKLGDTDGDNDFDQLYTLGGRSFSIFRAGNSGVLTRVYDSGDELEQLTAALVPTRFNGDPVFDTRSDNKGPEPEGVTLGVINGRTYAFLGLERTNGVMMFDVTNPTAPLFVQYVNTGVVNGSSETGDVSPEGLVFVPASQSPNGIPLLIVAFEVSGTVAVFEVR